MSVHCRRCTVTYNVGSVGGKKCSWCKCEAPGCGLPHKVTNDPSDLGTVVLIVRPKDTNHPNLRPGPWGGCRPPLVEDAA
jgi:hypothetical protein